MLSTRVTPGMRDSAAAWRRQHPRLPAWAVRAGYAQDRNGVIIPPARLRVVAERIESGVAA
jgi:hypothetical protein